jgi:hypothetical protein
MIPEVTRLRIQRDSLLTEKKELEADNKRLRESGDAVVRAIRPLLELNSKLCFDPITAAAALASWQALRESGAGKTK